MTDSPKAPEKIYLQYHGDEDPEFDNAIKDVSEGDVTWCSDKVYNWDIEYLRSDLVEKELREFYEYIRDYVELELTDRDESVVAKFLARKEKP